MTVEAATYLSLEQNLTNSTSDSSSTECIDSPLSTFQNLTVLSSEPNNIYNVHVLYRAIKAGAIHVTAAVMCVMSPTSGYNCAILVDVQVIDIVMVT